MRGPAGWRRVRVSFNFWILGHAHPFVTVKWVRF